MARTSSALVVPLVLALLCRQSHGYRLRPPFGYSPLAGRFFFLGNSNQPPVTPVEDIGSFLQEQKPVQAFPQPLIDLKDAFRLDNFFNLFQLKGQNIYSQIEGACKKKGGHLVVDFANKRSECLRYISNPSTFEEAKKECKRRNGALWVPNLEARSFLQILFDVKSPLLEIFGAPNHQIFLGIDVKDGNKFTTVHGDDVSGHPLLLAAGAIGAADSASFENRDCAVLELKNMFDTIVAKDCTPPVGSDPFLRTFVCEFQG